MNGWDFVAAMRTRPALDQVPVVVHSSASDRAPQGVTRVLRKPAQMETLLKVVHDYCAH
jgi:CheY-like chemotaxis protein